MNRTLNKKKQNKSFFGNLFFFVIIVLVIWYWFPKVMSYVSEPKEKMYSQHTVDSLVKIIGEYKMVNDYCYNRIKQLEQNIDTLKSNLTTIQDTIIKLNKKNEKTNTSSVVIHSEIPQFLPDRYNKNK